MSTVDIELPLGDVPEGVYVSRHVEVRLDPQQAHVLKALSLGLEQRNQRLANGRPIVSSADVVRWLMEQGAGIRGRGSGIRGQGTGVRGQGRNDK